MKSYRHFWQVTQHYSSSKFPSQVHQSSCTVIPLLANLAHTSRLTSVSRFSTPCTPSATPGLGHRLSLSPNASCGQPFKKTAALGPELAKLANVQKYLATPSPQSANSPSLPPASYTFTST